VRVGHLLGYARVSTTDQQPQLQGDELTAVGCWKLYTDTASGALDRRPALDAVLADLRPGDTLVVWRLDRLGRSLRHLIEVMTELDSRGVGFRSLRESIDTTTPAGRLVFHLFASLAQFERELIVERTKAGLSAARARGRKGGRPPALSAEQVVQARRMYDERELTVEQIAKVLRGWRTSIYRALRAQQTAAGAGTATAAGVAAPPDVHCADVRCAGRNGAGSPAAPPACTFRGGCPRPVGVVSRTHLSVRVELVSGRGEDFWPRPGRVLLAVRSMTFDALARAVDTAFGRWDLAHLHTFDLADGMLLTGPGDAWEDEPQNRPVARSDGVRLSRLAAGEQFSYTFDMGDDWTHLCTVGQSRVDPYEVYGLLPEVPVPVWGWGSCPISTDAGSTTTRNRPAPAAARPAAG